MGKAVAAGDVVSPTGVHFFSREQRPGLLPGILVSLMKERDDTKRKMLLGAASERASRK
jgi:DNA polymerase elongation subunit (family B)